MWILDTDVIVAMIRSRSGASAEIVRRCLRREVGIGLSVSLALEYEAVAMRPIHLTAGGLSESDAQTVIDALVSVAVWVEPHFLWRPQLRDPDDEMVLEAAVNGGAGAIVTFNRKDFAAAAERFGIDVLRPREALEMIR